MYFMSQNWLITHCLQPWSGLELTGVSEHPGMLSTMLVSCRLKRFWRGLSQFGGGGGAGERMRKVKCVHFLRGVTVDRRTI